MQTLDQTEDSLFQEPAHKAQVLVFTSGKASVGKTSIVANVAVSLTKKGAKVCVIDASIGYDNINMVLDIQPEYTFEQVLTGNKSVAEIINTSATGVSVVSGVASLVTATNLGEIERRNFLTALADIETAYDYVLIDIPAGVTENLLQVIESAPYAFMVMTADPAAMSESFSLLKALKARHYQGCLRVVVSMAVDYPSATETFRRFALTIDQYLGLKVEYGGFVIRDEHLPQSIALQIPLIVLAVNVPASRCLHALADNILKYIGTQLGDTAFSEYWRNWLTNKQQVEQFLTEPSDVETAVVSDQYHLELATVEELETIEYSSLPTRVDNITPQIIIDESAMMMSGKMAAEAMSKILVEIKTEFADKAVFEVFFGQYLAEFVEQFADFPANFPQLCRNWLINDVNAVQSLALAQENESELSALIAQLRTAYRQIHGVDVFDPAQELLASIQSHDFAEERFEGLLNDLRDGFASNFNKPYQGQNELLLESTAEQLAGMAEDERVLQQEISRLMETAEQLASRRESLLAAINSARDNQMSFKTVNPSNR